ncbi:MAG: hypothetical protein ACTSPY_06240 [Candidatus Helarchaeota archaeon]
MKKRKQIRRPTCLDEVLFCQICGKAVKQGLFNTADYFRCELNHITCSECKEKFYDKCSICELPYLIEELKTLF